MRTGITEVRVLEPEGPANLHPGYFDPAEFLEFSAFKEKHGRLPAMCDERYDFLFEVEKRASVSERSP